MILLGLLLLIVGLVVAAVVPDPMAAQLGRLVAAIGAVLLIVGVVLLALDHGHGDWRAAVGLVT